MPDSDYSIRRRFRASCTELERAGADEDTAAGLRQSESAGLDTRRISGTLSHPTIPRGPFHQACHIGRSGFIM